MGKYKHIAIYGGGSWGTALACQVAQNQPEVELFVRNGELAHEISSNNTNNKYLNNIILPKNIRASTDLTRLINKEVIIIAVPSTVFVPTLFKLKEAGLQPNAVLLIATKGLADDPVQLLSDKVKSLLPNPIAFISGPNFAKELAQNLLTTITIAAEDIKTAEKLAASLISANLIITATSDIITVQIAGAVKNIIAIRSGMYDAMGYGENAKAGLITQGMQEIRTLSSALGGKVDTLLEPAVLGDLILTCYSKTSRNTKFGFELAKQPDTVEKFLKNYPHLVEGREAVGLIIDLANRYNLKLPIISSVAQSLNIILMKERWLL